MADEIKWIKICTDMFNNRKMQLIEEMPEGDTIIVIWVKLLCLAGDVNDAGVVYVTREVPYTDEMLATVFRRPLQKVRLALMTFEKFGMIDIIDDLLHVSNWAKYQNVDGMEKIKEQTRKRVAKHRSKKLLSNSNCNVTGNVTVTHCNAIDKDIEEDKELDIYNNQQEEEDIYNNAHANLIDFFSNEIGRPLSPIEMELVMQWEKDYSPDLVKLALKEAVVNNKRTFKYIEAILVSWKGKGIRTAIEAQQEIEQFNNRKSSANSDELEDIKKQYCIMRNSAETIDTASQLRMRYYNLTGRDIEEDVQDE